MAKYAISDIHACVRSFKALLEKINFSRKDKLYLLGDYINRGPDSKGVIDYIWHLQDAGYSVQCLRGNHEQLLLNELDGKSLRKGAGKLCLKSFGAKRVEQIPQKYIHWMRSLKYYVEVDHFILVHAGLDFKRPNPLKGKYAMLWEKGWYRSIDKAWLDDRIVIHGHTPTRKRFIEASVIGSKLYAINIDNGCVLSKKGFGRLCCINLNTLEVRFQKNIDI